MNPCKQILLNTTQQSEDKLPHSSMDASKIKKQRLPFTLRQRPGTEVVKVITLVPATFVAIKSMVKEPKVIQLLSSCPLIA